MSVQIELPVIGDVDRLTLETGLTWSLVSCSRSCRLYVSAAGPDGVTWFCYSGRLSYEAKVKLLDLARGGPVKYFQGSATLCNSLQQS